MSKRFKKWKEELRNKPFAFYGVYIWSFFLILDGIKISNQVQNQEFIPWGLDYWVFLWEFVLWMIFRIEWYQYKELNNTKN